MKIAILGGSFDPPHIGHLIIAQQVREILQLDEVWLMPLYKHAFAKPISPSQDRLNMTKFLENDFIKVSDFEIKQRNINYTINTLDKLEKRYPTDTFYWIAGSDQLDSFHKYKDWQKLISEFNIIFYPRGYYYSNLETQVKKTFQLKTIPDNVIVLSDSSLILTDISSLKIKEKVKNHKTIDFYVLPKVIQYIYKKKLYL